MKFRHHASVVACACAVMLGVPALALGAPTLTSPGAGASNFTAGDSMTFEWEGNLEGHTSAQSQSYFRLEIIKASDLPDGSQSEWPDSIIEKFVQTEPGRSVASVEVGVPAAGEYRWRVCAWGVVNPVALNEVQQLPDGCSSSRTFETVAASSGAGDPGELVIDEVVDVPGPQKVIRRTRPDARSTNPVVPTSGALDPNANASGPAAFVGGSLSDAIAPGSSSVSLSNQSSAAAGDEAESGAMGQLGDTVATVFNASVPGVPVPFWTLVLFAVCVPIVRLWRRGVIAMFDVTDGTEPDGLAIVPVAQEVKYSALAADGTAPAVPTADPEPDRGRWAA